MSPVSLVRRTISRHALLGAGDRVAVALSGGADSVATLRLLLEIAATADWSVAGVIHVNHGLRVPGAAEDEAFCRDLAAELDLPIHVAIADVRSLARAERRSIEAVARDVRYACFAGAAVQLHATAVATGHTLDDQAETVLLRLLRGAGLRGVAGIRPRRGLYVRPVLECRRTQLCRYLTARDQPFRHDDSNDDVSIARNRIRHDLVPVIERIAPGGVRALTRFASLARDLDIFLAMQATEVSASVVLTNEGGSLGLDAGILRELPASLARQVVMRLVERLRPGIALSVRHLEAVRTLAAADTPSGHLDLPGLAVERRGTVMMLRPAGPGDSGHADGSAALGFEHGLPVPGQVRIPETGVTISAERRDFGDPAGAASTAAWLQADSVRPPFTVRTRRDGDRLRPLGAPGRRKLQDLFVDRKVPRAERDSVPVVVDADGRIVWVAGVAIAHDCRVTMPEAGVVILEMK